MDTLYNVIAMLFFISVFSASWVMIQGGFRNGKYYAKNYGRDVTYPVLFFMAFICFASFCLMCISVMTLAGIM